MSDTNAPIRLSEAHLNAAIEVMGKAFLNDPFLKYLVPDEAQRMQLTPEFMSIVVKYCFFVW